ncbi:MAG: hypothetical protein DMG57_03980 [Acidobacteria bacterium]|nr:MAG: hypothetical protein DMG57_03980 [Acidobacteriota bacterium]
MGTFAVQTLATFRFWAAVAWLIVSPCLVPRANAAYGELPLFFISWKIADRRIHPCVTSSVRPNSKPRLLRTLI